MKTASKQTVEDALTQCQSIENQILQDEQFVATAAAELATLEANVKFTDVSGLARITALQTIAALAPRRTVARQEKLASAERDLLGECHAFISNNLGPRCRDLVARAKTRVRQDLSKHIKEEGALERAVETSDLVLGLPRISFNVNIEHDPMRGTKIYAQKLIQAWDEADAFEKANLS